MADEQNALQMVFLTVIAPSSPSRVEESEWYSAPGLAVPLAKAPAPKAGWVGKTPGVPGAAVLPGPSKASSCAWCSLRPSDRNSVLGPSNLSAPAFNAS